MPKPIAAILEAQLKEVVGESDPLCVRVSQITGDDNSVKVSQIREILVPELSKSNDECPENKKDAIYETIQQMVHEYPLNQECPIEQESIALGEQSTPEERNNSYAYSCVSGRIYTKTSLIAWLDRTDYANDKTDPTNRGIYSAYEIAKLGAQASRHTGTAHWTHPTHLFIAGRHPEQNTKILLFMLLLGSFSAAALGVGAEIFAETVEDKPAYPYQWIVTAAASVMCVSLCYYAHRKNQLMANAQGQATLNHEQQFDKMITYLMLFTFIPAQAVAFLVPMKELESESNVAVSAIAITLTTLFLLKHAYQYGKAQLHHDDYNHYRKIQNTCTLMISLGVPMLIATLSNAIGLGIADSPAIGSTAGLFLGMGYYTFRNFSPYRGNRRLPGNEQVIEMQPLSM